MDNLLTRRVEKVLPTPQELEKVMGSKKIRVYIGVDPTATRLHLGHTIGLQKLMEFANAGHEAILLMGTGTVLVGDPSLRAEARKLIDPEQIAKNIATWKEQVAPILNFDKVQVRQNGDWLAGMTLKDLVQVASHISATQLFKRESFTRRLERGDTVWYHETMYPLLQGYDSVIMDVDLEIGGTDQQFNMLMGRELQKKMNNREKFVLTTPMILGTDGQQMSKTSGNCIWLNDSPNDMYGKLMTMNDAQIVEYARLVSNMPDESVVDIEAQLEKGVNPRDVKAQVAKAITAQYSDESEAAKAEEAFVAQFQKAELPEDIPQYFADRAEQTLVDVLVATNLASSNSEARRLINQRAVKINREKITAQNVAINDGDILQVGKLKFIKIRFK